MTITHGNFDKLAKNYNKYRPEYSIEVLNSLLNMHRENNLTVADIGAGTGIWTRMLLKSKKILKLYAVEPSENMKQFGESHIENGGIEWLIGSAENSNLKSNSLDIVTMASSFHWTNFELATKEFHRILKNNGLFCALWNPRIIKESKLFLDIENKIIELNPKIQRVSSGKSEFVERITNNFKESKYFEELKYIEGKHKLQMTKDHYLGAWLSVNDIQHQLGSKFDIFIEYIKERIKNEKVINASYLTRAWVVKKKN